MQTDKGDMQLQMEPERYKHPLTRSLAHNPNLFSFPHCSGIRAWFAWTYSDRAWAPYICTVRHSTK